MLIPHGIQNSFIWKSSNCIAIISIVAYHRAYDEVSETCFLKQILNAILYPSRFQIKSRIAILDV